MQFRAGTACSIKLYNFQGSTIGHIRNYPGIIGQKLSPPASVAFHGYRGLAAYGGIDGYIMLVESAAKRRRGSILNVSATRIAESGMDCAL